MQLPEADSAHATIYRLAKAWFRPQDCSAMFNAMTDEERRRCLKIFAEADAALLQAYRPQGGAEELSTLREEFERLLSIVAGKAGLKEQPKA